MLKLKIISLILLLNLTAFGQETEVSTTKNIITQKTKNHIRIPGTRLFIVIPKGFILSDLFLGIQMGEKSYMQVFDLDGGNFYSNSRSISKENLQAKGLKVYDYAEFQFNNYPAKFASVQAADSYRSHQLIFGDSTFSVMLIGLFDENEQETGNRLKQAMLSSYYDASLKIDPFEIAKFTIDESVTRYKFYQYSSNLYNYTQEGKKNENRFSPAVIITQLPCLEGSTFETIIEESVNGLKQNTFIQTGVDLAHEKIINGEKGFEKILRGYLNRKKVKLYYSVLKNKNLYIIFLGISYAEDESDLTDFKTLAQTLKLK